MSLRVLAVGIELLVGLLLFAFGVGSTARPAWWRWRGAHWWVDRTHRAVSRFHGLGVGLIGVAIAVSAPAPLLTTPAATGAIDAHVLEVVGLVVVLWGGILLACSYPASEDVLAPEQHGHTDQATTSPSPA